MTIANESEKMRHNRNEREQKRDRNAKKERMRVKEKRKKGMEFNAHRLVILLKSN